MLKEALKQSRKIMYCKSHGKEQVNGEMQRGEMCTDAFKAVCLRFWSEVCVIKDKIDSDCAMASKIRCRIIE